VQEPPLCGVWNAGPLLVVATALSLIDQPIQLDSLPLFWPNASCCRYIVNRGRYRQLDTSVIFPHKLSLSIKSFVWNIYHLNPTTNRMHRLSPVLGYLLLLHFSISGVSVASDKFSTIAGNAKPSIATRHTLKELRNLHVVKQQLDYSCGAAALGTLMIYYFGEKTSEKEILDLLNIRIKKLTKKEISRKKMVGFSLLDLKYVAQQKGYKAAGFQLTLEQLKKLAAPVIVYVLPGGYHHFAVLRGMIGDRAFLADPDRGNLSMSIDRFSKEYGGIAFVLGKEGEERITHYPLALGRSGDYAQPDWRRRVFTGNDFGAYTASLALRARARPLH